MSDQNLMEAFECQICMNQRSMTTEMVCPGCGLHFCTSCQRQYAKGECMGCHIKFKQAYLVEHLGQSFINTVVKPQIVEELMREQKEGLRQVQPLIDWEKEYRQQKKNVRFGIPISLPPRPKISATIPVQATVFPCPVASCRGFVENGKCGLCKETVCLRCRELLTPDHVCKVEDLQSIALLLQDSKQCPRCCATIHRTEGCNHMFCTNCRTHFDWVNGTILKTSSNGHYLHLQRFSDNIPVRQLAGVADEADRHDDNACQEGFSIYRDRVKLADIPLGQLSHDLIHSLWDDSNTIRLMKRKKYNEPEIENEYRESLQEMQVNYLLNELSETQWRRGVYLHYNKHQLSLVYSDVLNLYLASVDAFQQLLHAGPSPAGDQWSSEEILSQYGKLVDLCNQSFQSLQEEYGGKLHHIRHPHENTHVPAFV
uniref:RING-type domain-containing protein n=1 Tax=viral metagenome TaxID=1070528 RepID=A0A6C0BLP7_9ZZZZ